MCTRYAPSPTGSLHVGGARTALFNYLYAKKNDGKFILRIEDTDKARNITDGHIAIENDLKALNIFPDESFSVPGSRGPYLQSQKLNRYHELADKLLKEGKAYRCFCTGHKLEESRQAALANNSTPIYSRKCRFLSEEEIQKNLADKKPYTIRLKVDILEKYEWNDLIRGNISVPEYSMSDYVIMRSDKSPTYNFTVTVDDFDMGITCVLRGEEHIANTPYQLATYHALGFVDGIPNFGHLSIIVDKDRKKMSKRSEDEFNFVSGLISKGYLPEAIVNFLALLGWSHGEQEIFSHEELIKLFDISSVSKSPAFFDIEKLNWINHKYIQGMTQDYYLNYLIPIFTVDLGEYEQKKKLFALANKKNIYYGSQLNELALEFYTPGKLTPDLIDILKKGKKVVSLAYDNFPRVEEDWNQTTIRNYLKQLSQVSGIKGKDFFKPLRVACSFKEEGFELSNVLECLGRDTVIKNLVESLEAVKSE